MDIIIKIIGAYGYWAVLILLVIKLIYFWAGKGRHLLQFFFFSSQSITYSNREKRKSFKQNNNRMTIVILIILLVTLLINVLIVQDKNTPDNLENITPAK